MKCSREIFAQLDKEKLIDIVFALDGALNSINNNNARLTECFPSVKNVNDAVGLIGSWTAANALTIQSVQQVMVDSFANSAAKLN